LLFIFVHPFCLKKMVEGRVLVPALAQLV